VNPAKITGIERREPSPRMVLISKDADEEQEVWAEPPGQIEKLQAEAASHSNNAMTPTRRNVLPFILPEA
jgi:hypothetical protein